MIFIDRSVPRSVADALKLVRPGDVVWLEDVFPHNTPDEAWIPEVATRGWLTVSRDKNIRRRRRQRELILAHGMGCFILNQKLDSTRWGYLKQLAAGLDEMERVFAIVPRPFIFLVDASGQLRRFA